MIFCLPLPILFEHGQSWLDSVFYLGRASQRVKSHWTRVKETFSSEQNLENISKRELIPREDPEFLTELGIFQEEPVRWVRGFGKSAIAAIPVAVVDRSRSRHVATSTEFFRYALWRPELDVKLVESSDRWWHRSRDKKNIFPSEELLLILIHPRFHCRDRDRVSIVSARRSGLGCTPSSLGMLSQPLYLRANATSSSSPTPPRNSREPVIERTLNALVSNSLQNRWYAVSQWSQKANYRGRRTRFGWTRTHRPNNYASLFI